MQILLYAKPPLKALNLLTPVNPLTLIGSESGENVRWKLK